MSMGTGVGRQSLDHHFEFMIPPMYTSLRDEEQFGQLFSSVIISYHFMTKSYPDRRESLLKQSKLIHTLPCSRSPRTLTRSLQVFNCRSSLREDE